MSKQTDQSELSQIIALQTRLDQHIVDAFIGQLFNEIEKSLVVDSHIKVDGLGLFRVIKSGNSHRILYLGSNAPIDKTIDLSHLNNESKKEQTIEDHPKENEMQYSLAIEESSDHTKAEMLNVEKELVSDNEISESDAIVIRNFHKSEKGSNRIQSPAVNPRKSNLVKTCIITLIVLAVLGIGYIILSGYTIKHKEKLPQSITFKELDNTDTLTYSRIIIPESDVSLQYIAKIYYGDDVYWPYIYNANNNIVNNLLIIQAGSITKIPKISVDLVNLHNGKEASTARVLGDEIYKEIR
ncbi:hypothetical protein G7051_02085 [Dysgonomonas sp. HDW5B]|uniref:hypothetical protein n=1 Tax=Dysgonomonas sp. HDW5B TaxID=2714927 RepID=UPI00140BE097|nr:hypothetical protein [Dysgonomonas sp. HDW5B]QIK53199.1 hypothetical protein G7051_02085 [Dysgonomonas sp. HDW5B]